MVHLIGPGGAGKTTVGTALATRLGAQFVDLDAEFTSRHGDISAFLDKHGYAAYACRNVDVSLELAGGSNGHQVVALSSGFMTYASDVHPDYLICRHRLALSPSAFVLLPSLQLETCVNETVRRQLGRPFARSAEREEQVIRARFPIYVSLPGRKIETMQPVETVVTELLSALAAQLEPAPGSPGLIDHFSADSPARRLLGHRHGAGRGLPFRILSAQIEDRTGVRLDPTGQTPRFRFDP